MTDLSFMEGKHLHVVLHPLETRQAHYQELHLAAATDGRHLEDVNMSKQNKQTNTLIGQKLLLIAGLKNKQTWVD